MALSLKTETNGVSRLYKTIVRPVMGHSSTISPRQSGILGVPLVLQTSQLRVRLLVISGNILPSSAQGWGHQGGSSTKKKRRLKTNTIGNWYFTLCTCSAQLYKFVLVSQQGWPPTSNILSTISDILHVNQGSARYSRCRWIYSWNAHAQGRFFIKNILQKVGMLWTPAYTPGRRSDQSGVLQQHCI